MSSTRVQAQTGKTFAWRLLEEVHKVWKQVTLEAGDAKQSWSVGALAHVCGKDDHTSIILNARNLAAVIYCLDEDR
jgi:hypothetical protein